MIAAPGTAGWPSSISTGVVAFGVERQEFLAPLPHALLDQTRRDAEFAQHQAHEARMRAERMMEERDHSPRSICLAPRCGREPR